MKYLLLLLVCNCLCSCEEIPTVKTGLEGKIIPSFNILLMDSTSQFNTISIPMGKPVVFIFFSPGCPYCRALTEEIVRDIQSLNDIQFYAISPYPFDQIKNFYKYYRLKEYPNIIVGQDYGSFFQSYFRADAVPYIAIYNRESKLEQVLIGKVSTSVIRAISLR